MFDSEPVAMFGALEGGNASRFADVRGLSLLDSGILVLDEGTREVLELDLRGHERNRAGGVGEGPGEILITTASWVDARGRVVVLDAQQRRVTAYGQDGRISDLEYPSMPMQGPEAVRWIGRFADTWVALTAELQEPPAPGGFREGRIGIRLVREEPPLDSTYFDAVGTAWYTTRGGQTAMFPPALVALPIVRVRGDRAAFLNDLELFLVDRSLDVRHLLLQDRCPTVPEGYFRDDDQGDGLRGGIPADEFRRWVPECAPSYDGLSLTPEGRAWVRLAGIGLGEESQDAQWIVVHPDGSHVSVMLPSGFFPMDVAGDVVYGRWQDARYVQYVTGLRVAGL